MPDELDRQTVTLWISDLKAGDPDAAAQLWKRYFDDLVNVANRKLGKAPQRAVDAEDNAVSGFDTPCRGAHEGRFEKLKDRDDTLRRIALMRMEGYSNSQIAESIGVSERSVERKLNLIRSDWAGEFDLDEA